VLQDMPLRQRPVLLAHRQVVNSDGGEHRRLEGPGLLK
jgi:hypothetical protein